MLKENIAMNHGIVGALSSDQAICQRLTSKVLSHGGDSILPHTTGNGKCIQPTKMVMSDWGMVYGIVLPFGKLA